jgi:hypothetical protein
VVIGVIPAQAAYFQARPAVTKRVRSALRGTGAQVVVRGFGGVGKTQVAAAFARTLLRVHGTDVLVWASASAPGAIVTAYASAAKALQLPTVDDGVDTAALAFRSWLDQADRRWTIVFDDVGDADLVREWWPPVVAVGPPARHEPTPRRHPAGRTAADRPRRLHR